MLALVLGARLLPEDFRLFARGATLFALVQISFSAFDVLLGQRYPLWGYWLEGGYRSANSLLSDEFFRGQGLASHSIVYSLCVLLGISFVLTNAVKFKQSLRVLVGAGLIFGLIISGTRSAVLAAIIVVTIYGFLEVRRVSQKLMFALGMFVLGAYFLQASNAVKFVDSLAADLFGSASYTHRLDGLNAVGDVASDRGLLGLLFGQGGASVSDLFARGFLQQDGLAVVDNQLVTTFIVGGFIGISALSLCVIAGLLARRSVGVAMAALFIMMFSFDVLTWPAGVLLLYSITGSSLSVGRSERVASGSRTRRRRTSHHAAGQQRHLTSSTEGRRS
ncbi:hypothetical protein V1638_00775 [Pseudarthrobacter sp. J64]|uniref:hypothetical protein n=1 Tax=Pseudarthrobacter sp. J64 TaxID=3116485 RepID=UPI002E815B07|nr:hypothetical protein [Pseudarthrobacter sp. J64]MEE2567934.1 hypothetical protein [Pseudarthrobacter sp. J64]